MYILCRNLVLAWVMIIDGLSMRREHHEAHIFFTRGLFVKIKLAYIFLPCKKNCSNRFTAVCFPRAYIFFFESQQKYAHMWTQTNRESGETIMREKTGIFISCFIFFSWLPAQEMCA